MKSWDPFRDLLGIQDRMNKLFESVLTGPVPMSDSGDASVWRPVSEVLETEETLEIECELAGLSLDDISLHVDDGILIVEGERRREREPSGWTFHQLERPFGKFLRRFELPEGLDLAGIQRELDDGVLRVSLPKSPVVAGAGEGERPDPS